MKLARTFGLGIACLVLIASASGQNQANQVNEANLSAPVVPHGTSPVVRSAKGHTAAPVFTDWVPQHTVWSKSLLKDVGKTCSSFIGKYQGDPRYNIDRNDVHEFADCQIHLFDSIGSFRATMNNNPILKSHKKRDQLRVFVAVSYGADRKWGFYTWDELTKAAQAIR